MALRTIARRGDRVRLFRPSPARVPWRVDPRAAWVDLAFGATSPRPGAGAASLIFRRAEQHAGSPGILGAPPWPGRPRRAPSSRCTTPRSTSTRRSAGRPRPRVRFAGWGPGDARWTSGWAASYDGADLVLAPSRSARAPTSRPRLRPPRGRARPRRGQRVCFHPRSRRRPGGAARGALYVRPGDARRKKPGARWCRSFAGRGRRSTSRSWATARPYQSCNDSCPAPRSPDVWKGPVAGAGLRGRGTSFVFSLAYGHPGQTSCSRRWRRACPVVVADAMGPKELVHGRRHRLSWPTPMPSFAGAVHVLATQPERRQEMAQARAGVLRRRRSLGRHLSPSSSATTTRCCDAAPRAGPDSTRGARCCPRLARTLACILLVALDVAARARCGCAWCCARWDIGSGCGASSP